MELVRLKLEEFQSVNPLTHYKQKFNDDNIPTHGSEMIFQQILYFIHDLYDQYMKNPTYPLIDQKEQFYEPIIPSL